MICIPEIIIRLWTIALVSASLIYALMFGFAISEAAGRFAGIVVIVSFSLAVTLFFSSRNWGGAILLSFLTFITTIFYIYFYGSLSTFLDVLYRGAYGWSETRTMVIGLLVGPFVGMINAIIVFLAVMFRFIVAR